MSDPQSRFSRSTLIRSTLIRSTLIRSTLIVILVILTLFFSAIIVVYSFNAFKAYSQQLVLEDFYTVPEEFSDIPGTLVRLEPLGIDIADASAYRMLYVTQDQQGNPVVAGGMAFLPNKKAETPRRVVAFIEGTTGQADECAPSRSPDPPNSLSTFLPEAMTQGWAVVAPDEFGVGMPGTQRFLVKDQIVRDTVNSVRALQTIPGSMAGDDYAVFGYSEGGHGALWTGHLSKQFAPELNLVGVAAIAPAADLMAIIGRHWNTEFGWGIAVDAVRSWSLVYPNIAWNSLLTDAGRTNYERMANECTLASVIEGLVRNKIFNQNLFIEDPTKKDSPLTQALLEQTPPPMSSTLPIMLVQGTADQLALAGFNADLQESWCAAGSTLDALWLGGVDHRTVAVVAGPSVAAWIADRFSGLPAPNTCNVAPPRSLITVR